MGQLAKLSGSFALSGLVAHSLIVSKSDAYFSPVYVPLLELPYPVRRPSGKVVKDFRAKEPGEAEVVSGPPCSQLKAHMPLLPAVHAFIPCWMSSSKGSL